jgi:hypothetical protein
VTTTAAAAAAIGRGRGRGRDEAGLWAHRRGGKIIAKTASCNDRKNSIIECNILNSTILILFLENCAA